MTRELTFDIETTDLNPRQGKVICIGVQVSPNRHHVFQDEDEEEMLRRFFLYATRLRPKRVIGYNTGFDIRFLFARAIYHGVCGNGFFRQTRTDLQSIMKSVGHRFSRNKAGSLEDWSQFLLSEQKTLQQENVPELYERGEISKITEYVSKDVEITYKLWQRINQTLEGHGFRRASKYG